MSDEVFVADGGGPIELQVLFVSRDDDDPTILIPCDEAEAQFTLEIKPNGTFVLTPVEKKE